MRFLILITLLIIPSIGFGQMPGGYIGIRFGPSIPTGDYAATNISNEGAGFAQTGINIGFLEGGYFFHDNIGVAAKLSASAHGIDGQTLVNELGQQSDVDKISVETDGPYSTSSFTIGPIFQYSLSESFLLRGKVLLGSFYGTTPKTTITVTDGNSQRQNTVKEGEGSTFNVDAGVSLHYQFADHWDVNFGIDHQGATPKIKYPDSEPVKQPMHFWSVSLGINYVFQ